MKVLDLYSTDLTERAEALDALFRVSNPNRLERTLAVTKPKLLVFGTDRYTQKLTWRVYRFWRKPVFGPIRHFSRTTTKKVY